MISLVSHTNSFLFDHITSFFGGFTTPSNCKGCYFAYFDDMLCQLIAPLVLLRYSGCSSMVHRVHDELDMHLFCGQDHRHSYHLVKESCRMLNEVVFCSLNSIKVFSTVSSSIDFLVRSSSK
jgi:hypothetical protein